MRDNVVVVDDARAVRDIGAEELEEGGVTEARHAEVDHEHVSAVHGEVDRVEAFLEGGEMSERVSECI